MPNPSSAPSGIAHVLLSLRVKSILLLSVYRMLPVNATYFGKIPTHNAIVTITPHLLTQHIFQ